MKSLNIQGDRAEAVVPLTVLMRSPGYHPGMHMPGREFGSRTEIMGYFELVRRGSRWLIEDYKFERI